MNIPAYFRHLLRSARPAGKLTWQELKFEFTSTQLTCIDSCTEFHSLLNTFTSLGSFNSVDSSLRRCCYLWFTPKETDSEKLSYLPEVTQQSNVSHQSRAISATPHRSFHPAWGLLAPLPLLGPRKFFGWLCCVF